MIVLLPAAEGSSRVFCFKIINPFSFLLVERVERPASRTSKTLESTGVTLLT